MPNGWLLEDHRPPQVDFGGLQQGDRVPRAFRHKRPIRDESAGECVAIPVDGDRACGHRLEPVDEPRISERRAHDDVTDVQKVQEAQCRRIWLGGAVWGSSRNLLRPASVSSSVIRRLVVGS